MSARITIKGFSTFVAFNSCTRQAFGFQARTLCSYRSQYLRLKPVSPSRRIADKRSIHATAPRGAASKNPYEVLGVKPDATAAEIKKTYFSLARKYHPDTNPDKGARDKFVEIQDAYDILKDDKKRAAYDQYGAASQQPNFDPNAFGAQGAGGFSGFHGFGSPFSSRSGSGADLFEEIFGAFGGATARGRGRKPESVRGSDIETTLNISFLEACKGTKKQVSYMAIIDCEPCNGSGLKEGVKRTTCSSCGGSGTRTFVLDNGFQMASGCDNCHGSGSTVPRGGECRSCAGKGKVRAKRDATVVVPVGAEEGMTVRISDMGDAPTSGKGPKGDLYIRLNVSPSSTFQRQGANLYYKAKIPFHRALLGGIVRVPTLDGEVDVRIPGGTQQGEEMVLKGRGVNYLQGSGHGDLYVKFNLQLPRILTKHQRDLLQAYADDVEGHSKPKTASSKEDPLSADNDASKAKDDNTAKRATG